MQPRRIFEQGLSICGVNLTVDGFSISDVPSVNNPKCYNHCLWAAKNSTYYNIIRLPIKHLKNREIVFIHDLEGILIIILVPKFWNFTFRIITYEGGIPNRTKWHSSVNKKSISLHIYPDYELAFQWQLTHRPICKFRNWYVLRSFNASAELQCNVVTAFWKLWRLPFGHLNWLRFGGFNGV